MLGNDWSHLNMKSKMDRFMDYFTKITQEDSDFIEHVLSWDDETKAAFMFAKRIFEGKDETDGVD